MRERTSAERAAESRPLILVLRRKRRAEWKSAVPCEMSRWVAKELWRSRRRVQEAERRKDWRCWGQ
jgi:hypothetical protein